MSTHHIILSLPALPHHIGQVKTVTGQVESSVMPVFIHRLPRPDEDQVVGGDGLLCLTMTIAEWDLPAVGPVLSVAETVGDNARLSVLDLERLAVTGA